MRARDNLTGWIFAAALVTGSTAIALGVLLWLLP